MYQRLGSFAAKMANVGPFLVIFSNKCEKVRMYEGVCSCSPKSVNVLTFLLFVDDLEVAILLDTDLWIKQDCKEVSGVAKHAVNTYDQKSRLIA